MATDFTTITYTIDEVTGTIADGTVFVEAGERGPQGIPGEDGTGGPGGGADLSDDTPVALGTAGPGVSDEASRSDHRHAMPSASDVGAATSTAPAAAVATHVALPDPHAQYALESAIGTAAATDKDIDGTLAANSDTRVPTQKATKAYVDALASSTTSALAGKQASLGFTAENSANKDTDTTLGSNSDTKYPSQKAVKAYIDGRLAAADAVLYKGTIDASANPNYPAADAGHLYRISVAGKIGGASGVNVEVGDTILCLTDSTASGNQATVGANWDIIQTNIDGAVVGPASATSANLPAFSGTTGKILSDSGVAPSTDATLASNSDAKLPTEKAVKGYVTTQAGLLVPKSLFDANTILIATADDTPTALAVGASRILGRKATGPIVDLNPSEANVVLGNDALAAGRLIALDASTAPGTTSIIASDAIVRQLFAHQGATVTHSVGTTETTLLSSGARTIPANTWSLDTSVEILLFGMLTNNSGAGRSYVFKIKIGSNALLTITTPSLTNSATARNFEIRAQLDFTSFSGTRGTGVAHFHASAVTAVTDDDEQTVVTGLSGSTADLTISNAFDVTVTLPIGTSAQTIAATLMHVKHSNLTRTA